METPARLQGYLKEVCLPGIRDSYAEVAQQAIAESLSYEQFLLELLVPESQVRRQSRIERLRHESRLPSSKRLATLEMSRLPGKVRQQVAVLREGGFLDRRENVLGFGNPGSGTTHVGCGVCHEWVERGRRVLSPTCSLLVQKLRIAKRDLRLWQTLKKLSRYEGLLIDDLGYVQQSREEMEVLFTLRADRYERGSVLITSNLPFSAWEAIFKDPMTTAAAIDRLVHPSGILELNLPSYRMEHAKQKQTQEQKREE